MMLQTIGDKLEWLRQHCDVCVTSMEDDYEPWSVTVAVKLPDQRFKEGFAISCTSLAMACEDAIAFVVMIKKIDPKSVNMHTIDCHKAKE